MIDDMHPYQYMIPHFYQSTVCLPDTYITVLTRFSLGYSLLNYELRQVQGKYGRTNLSIQPQQFNVTLGLDLTQCI